MSRLHIYTVHINPAQPHAYESAQFVQEGFSWAAFVFGPLWMLYHRLWGKTVLLLLINAVIAWLVSAEIISVIGAAIVDFGVQLLVGFYAYDWQRSKLAAQGFITSDIITGDSLLRGQQRFFERYFAAQSATGA